LIASLIDKLNEGMRSIDQAIQLETSSFAWTTHHRKKIKGPDPVVKVLISKNKEPNTIKQQG